MKTSENTAAFAGGAGLVAAIIMTGMTRYTGLLAFSALLPLVFMLLTVSAIAFIRLRLDRLAGEEKRDHTLRAKEQPESALFHASDPDEVPFTIGRSRGQLEKYVVPWVAPLLGAVQLFWAWKLFTALPRESTEPSHLALSGSLLGVMAFVFFLTSRFMLGLSRHPGSRLLRGPGVVAGLVCWGMLAGLAGAMAEHFGWTQADEWAARVLLAATALLGLECLLNSLLALYSHRREERVTTYESKLGALLVDPGLLTKSVTEAMDYQFGFSFSQTWFFKILQKAIIPLLVVQAVLLYTMSSFVFLAPHETGILERFGKPVASAATLGSGLHIKRPWPLETVRRVPTGRIQNIEIGFEPHRDGHRPEIIAWDAPHYAREDIFLVASRSAMTASPEARDASAVPVSMITVNVPVEYRITNAYAYAYHYAEPERVIRQLTYQTVTRQLARRDLRDLFSEQRMAISRAMHEELQAAVDARQLGVVIDFLGLPGVHPPVQVAEAFQSVVGAMEEKEAAILDARAYTNRVLPLARAYAWSAHVEAEAYRFRRIALAEAEGQQFVQRQIAYRQSPRVYRTYQYLDMLQHAAAPSRLYVLDLPAAGAQTLWLNLEEKVFSGALDMAPLMFEGGH